MPLKFVFVSLSHSVISGSLLKSELLEIYHDNTYNEIIGKIYSDFEQALGNGKDTEVHDRR